MATESDDAQIISLERRLRRYVAQHGYVLRKCRNVRGYEVGQLRCTYMVVDPLTKFPQAWGNEVDLPDLVQEWRG